MLGGCSGCVVGDCGRLTEEVRGDDDVMPLAVLAGVPSVMLILWLLLVFLVNDLTPASS